MITAGKVIYDIDRTSALKWWQEQYGTIDNLSEDTIANIIIEWRKLFVKPKVNIKYWNL